MLNDLVEYLRKMIQKFEKPQTYGSALEEYIVSNNPQDSYDVDRLAREFEQKNLNRTMAGWPL
jgi:hypothetical protein